MTDIIPNRWYTLDEVAKFRDNPAMADIVMKGYVLQQDIQTGSVRFVHHTKAAMDSGTTKSLQGKMDHIRADENLWGVAKETMFDKTELPPIVRRTPQQRLDSLMSKVGEDLKYLLNDPDGEAVTQMARDALEQAEVDFKKSEDKRITRTEGSPYA